MTQANPRLSTPPLSTSLNNIEVADRRRRTPGFSFPSRGRRCWRCRPWGGSFGAGSGPARWTSPGPVPEAIASTIPAVSATIRRRTEAGIPRKGSRCSRDFIRKAWKTTGALSTVHSYHTNIDRSIGIAEARRRKVGPYFVLNSLRSMCQP